MGKGQRAKGQKFKEILRRMGLVNENPITAQSENEMYFNG